jgi:prevent-host-death family protein
MSSAIRSTDVSSGALRAELGRYLDRTKSGEVFRILRRGKPAAALMSIELFERLTSVANLARRRRRRESGPLSWSSAALVQNGVLVEKRVCVCLEAPVYKDKFS